MTDIKNLIRICMENKKNSYAPYSKFKVSSLVRTKKGNIYCGVNIENAAYSPSLCAERSAMAQAISKGEKDFDLIIIHGDSDFTYPCGLCRQFMAEFFDKDTKIIVARNEDDFKTYKMEDILPYSFGKKDLEDK